MIMRFVCFNNYKTGSASKNLFKSHFIIPSLQFFPGYVEVSITKLKLYFCGFLRIMQLETIFNERFEVF